MASNLYIGSNGFVSAIDPQTGAEVWRTTLRTGGVLNSVSHQDVSVMVRDKVISAGCYGHLFALSEGGEILWHNSLKGLGHGPIALAFEGQSIQYLERVRHDSSPGATSTPGAMAS